MNSTTFQIAQKLIAAGFTATFNSAFRYSFNRYYDVAECNVRYQGSVATSELHRLHQIVSQMPFPCEIKLGRGDGDMIYMQITPAVVEYIQQEGISYPYFDDNNYAVPAGPIFTHEQFLNMHNAMA